MALDPSSGFTAGDTAAELTDAALPVFDVQTVRFDVAPERFVAGQAANNVLILALTNGRILRIDLNKPEDIDGPSSLPLPRSPCSLTNVLLLSLSPQQTSTSRRSPPKRASSGACSSTRRRRTS